MKRIVAVLAFLIFLCGCSETDANADRALSLRVSILNKEVAFFATVTADYGEQICSFKMDCTGSKSGEVAFRIEEPDTIKGISGVISEIGGDLRFDDKILGFPLMAEDAISPVSGPWIIMQALRSGYIRGTGEDGENLQVIIDDSYYGEPMQVNVWLDPADVPVFAEIIWKGSRVLSIQLDDFRFV